MKEKAAAERGSLTTTTNPTDPLRTVNTRLGKYITRPANIREGINQSIASRNKDLEFLRLKKNVSPVIFEKYLNKTVTSS